MPEEKPKRKNLSKKIRFEVFKRDSFTCQYCGVKAPNVVLQCDHIEPVSKGGGNDIMNLITACVDCNSGKSDRRLSDESVVEKQRQQLEELQERREQVEAMFKWQADLANMEESYVDGLASFWDNLVPGWSVSESGRDDIRKLRRTFTTEDIMEAMKTATQYIIYESGKVTSESWSAAWSKIGGICHINKAELDKPGLKRIYYIRGILRNRLRYCDEDKALSLLKAAVNLSASIDSLEEYAKSVNTWSQWRDGIEKFLANPGGAE